MAPGRPRKKGMTPQTGTLEMSRAVTMKEVEMMHTQCVLMHRVLQKEVEAMARKWDTEKAS